MSNLTEATRELFIRSVKDEVFMKTPFLDDLLSRKKITFSGGTSIKQLVKFRDGLGDIAQDYVTNDTLNDSATDYLAKPEWTWKKFTIPIRYDGDVEIQNENAGSEEQLLALVPDLVKSAQRDAKLHLNSLVFNSGSAAGVSDTGAKFQSLVSALGHDVTYGTLTRTLSTNTRNWWQGSDPAGLIATTTSAQGTATNFTISNIRKWIWETNVAHNLEGPGDIGIYVCPTLFNKLRAEMESKVIYKQGDPQSQGFEKMIVDGFTVVSVPFLQTTTTMKKWAFIVNLNDWELRLSTARNFKVTPFVWQGQNVNGVDYYLSRILVAGNLICNKPNGSLFLSNVS